MTDLGGLIDEHAVGALSGVLGTLLIKEMVGRFFRRSERVENKWDDRHEALITQLLDQVTGARLLLEVMGERFAGHQASALETKNRVDGHADRISALETGHAELRAKMEFISEAKDD
jgi:hypothetical protein